MPQVFDSIDLDEFVNHYAVAALWSSTDDSDRPLDGEYGLWDFSPRTLRQMREDCEAFIKANEADLMTWDGDRRSVNEQGGHDFWLTRNGHGAGFWDGDWQDAVGKRLTDAAHAFGEVWLYVGDDGNIHH